jgi:hypothetical protein
MITLLLCYVIIVHVKIIMLMGTVTPQVLLRVFTQDYTSKPIITCDLSWESTPNLELKILSKCNPSWKSYLGLSCTHNGESCPNPNANPFGQLEH